MLAVTKTNIYEVLCTFLTGFWMLKEMRAAMRDSIALILERPPVGSCLRPWLMSLLSVCEPETRW